MGVIDKAVGKEIFTRQISVQVSDGTMALGGQQWIVFFIARHGAWGRIRLMFGEGMLPDAAL